MEELQTGVNLMYLILIVVVIIALGMRLGTFRPKSPGLRLYEMRLDGETLERLEDIQEFADWLVEAMRANFAKDPRLNFFIGEDDFQDAQVSFEDAWRVIGKLKSEGKADADLKTRTILGVRLTPEGFTATCKGRRTGRS